MPFGFRAVRMPNMNRPRLRCDGTGLKGNISFVVLHLHPVTATNRVARSIPSRKDIPEFDGDIFDGPQSNHIESLVRGINVLLDVDIGIAPKPAGNMDSVPVIRGDGAAAGEPHIKGARRYRTRTGIRPVINVDGIPAGSGDSEIGGRCHVEASARCLLADERGRAGTRRAQTDVDAVIVLARAHSRPGRRGRCQHGAERKRRCVGLAAAVLEFVLEPDVSGALPDLFALPHGEACMEGMGIVPLTGKAVTRVRGGFNAPGGHRRAHDIGDDFPVQAHEDVPVPLQTDVGSRKLSWRK